MLINPRNGKRMLRPSEFWFRVAQDILDERWDAACAARPLHGPFVRPDMSRKALTRAVVRRVLGRDDAFTNKVVNNALMVWAVRDAQFRPYISELSAIKAYGLRFAHPGFTSVADTLVHAGWVEWKGRELVVGWFRKPLNDAHQGA